MGRSAVGLSVALIFFIVSTVAYSDGLVRECYVRLGELEKEASQAPDDIDGAKVFATAQKLKKGLHQKQVASGGKKLILPSNIPKVEGKDFLTRVLERLVKLTEEGHQHPTSHERPNPLASDNIGHIGDHFLFLDAFGADYVRYLGVDIESLRVVTAGHDYGKTIHHAALQKFIEETIDAAKTEGNPGNSHPGIEFVKKFVSSHDEHTLVHGLPKILAEVGKEHGLTKDQIADILAQFIHFTVNHNYGPLHLDPTKVSKEKALALIKKRYPELSDKEVEMVRNGFYARFYGNGIPGYATAYAHDMGIPLRMGFARGAIGNALATSDRSVVLAESTLNKFPNQDMKRYGFGPELIRQGLVEGVDAIGPTASALIKAQFYEMDRHRADGVKQETPETFPPTKFALGQAGKTIDLGNRLLKMNTADKQEAAGISPEQAKHTLLYEGADGKVYKIDGGRYVEEEGQMVFKPMIPPVVEVKEGKQWVAARKLPEPTSLVHQKAKANAEKKQQVWEDERTGWDIMMDFVRQDGGPVLDTIPVPARATVSTPAGGNEQRGANQGGDRPSDMPLNAGQPK